VVEAPVRIGDGIVPISPRLHGPRLSTSAAVAATAFGLATHRRPQSWTGREDTTPTPEGGRMTSGARHVE
jgi:hypothetical protein